MAATERMNSEKKIAHENFKLKIGTINRNNPQVVYVEGRTFISPNELKESYDRDIYEIKRRFKNSISDNIKNSSLFDNSYILDFQIAQNGITKGKKSFLSFQFLVKQNGENILKMKDIKNVASGTIYSIIKTLEEEICNHNFSIYKTKK